MIKTIILLAAITLFSCSKNSMEKTNKKVIENKKDSVINKNIPASDIEYAVVPAPKHLEYLFGGGYMPITPTDNEVSYALKMVDTVFYDQARGTANRLLDMKPRDYYMQVVGIQNPKGERMIWVNCFCRKQLSSFPNWKESIVEVEDGGKCFFNVMFNLDKKEEPYKLQVNGNA